MAANISWWGPELLRSWPWARSWAAALWTSLSQILYNFWCFIKVFAHFFFTQLQESFPTIPLTLVHDRSTPPAVFNRVLVPGSRPLTDKTALNRVWVELISACLAWGLSPANFLLFMCLSWIKARKSFARLGHKYIYTKGKRKITRRNRSLQIGSCYLLPSWALGFRPFGSQPNNFSPPLLRSYFFTSVPVYSVNLAQEKLAPGNSLDLLLICQFQWQWNNPKGFVQCAV